MEASVSKQQQQLKWNKLTSKKTKKNIYIEITRMVLHIEEKRSLLHEKYVIYFHLYRTAALKKVPPNMSHMFFYV